MPQKGWFTFRPGTDLPWLLLTSLEEGPKFTQELCNDIKEVFHTSLEPGTLYKIVRLLEQYGWIELQASEKKSRRAYRITHAGRLALHQHSVASFENRERIQSRSFVRPHKEHILMIIIAWILRLYPRAWRQRYEQEMLVLLEEHDITFFTGLDLLLGALDARLDPYYRRTEVRSPQQRLQSVRIATTVAFVVLSLSLLFSILMGLHVDYTWLTLRQAHPLIVIVLNVLMSFGNVLWMAALLVSLALLAYHGIKSGRRADRFLSTLPFVSAGIALLAFCAFLSPHLVILGSWLNNASWFGILGMPALIALAMARGNLSQRMLRLFMILGTVSTAGIVLSHNLINIVQAIVSILGSGSSWLLLLPGGIPSLLVVVVAIWLLMRGFAALRALRSSAEPSTETLQLQYVQQKSEGSF